jgi:hypothetical protein
MWHDAALPVFQMGSGIERASFRRLVRRVELGNCLNNVVYSGG